MLDNRIAKVIYDKWPGFLTQKEIADKLNVSQSLVSKQLSSWKKKESIPLKIRYEERNEVLEGRLKDTYNIDDVVVINNTNYFVDNKTYFNQIGRYASDILVRKINSILDKKAETLKNKSKDDGINNEAEIKISVSGGKNVFATMLSLADEIKDSDIKLLFSSCIALRSNNLIELTPLHLVSQLLNRRLNIEVKHTYQLPEVFNLYNKESLYEIIEQRIRTQKMLGFDREVLQSDLAIFGLGSIRWNLPKSGFVRHIRNLSLQSFLRKFDIMGEIAFAPFSKNGFLFHHLVTEVFSQQDGKFKYDENGQLEKLRKFAANNIAVSKQDLLDAANLFSSLFTLNFCEVERHLQQQSKRPYILLISGGESQKAMSLKIMLERWKNINILNGLVTSENIARVL